MLLAVWVAEVAPAEAQSGDGEGVSGRIVAQRLADGRTEFGWEPTGGERVLPRLRYFPVNVNDHGWRSSSPIEVGGAEIGRINARLSEDGRIEFAFTPTDGEQILPPARYFPHNATPRRWLRSTEIVLQGPTRAEKKDLLVERLYGLRPGEADARTNHDRNDWGCPFTGPSYGGNAGCRAGSFYGDGYVDPPPPSWTAYEGGHSGWDVSHKIDRDAPFFSLTDGTVIAAGRGWRCHDIAVFDGTNTIVYLHASRIDVNDGDTVFAGRTQLGLQGDACSEPPRGAPPNDHLHIEVIPGEAQIRSGGTTQRRYRIYARGAGLKPGSPKPCDEISADPLPYLYWWVAGRDAPRPNVQVAQCTPAPPNRQRINHGELIRGRSSPEVYVVKVENGKQFRRHVVAHGLYAAVPGWDEADVQIVSGASVDDIRESPLVRLPTAAARIHGGDTNSIYFVDETGEDTIVLRHIPNPEAFNRAGCDWDGVFAMSLGEYNYWRARIGVALNGGETNDTFRCPQ